MAIAKYSELKIASSVLGLPIKHMADELNVTEQTIRGVCNGTITSARVNAYIEAKIRESEKVYDLHRKEVGHE